MIPRYTRPEMAAIWTEEAKFQLWLDIEILALEQFVKDGLAPASALDAVREKATFSVERILEIEKEVKHDVIAFLMNVAESAGDDARYLHLGMTSSDVLDTTLSVQLSRASKLILQGIDTLLESVKKQAMKHKTTVCIGRSHGIHAEPTTFGLKLAVWYDELKRHRVRMEAATEDIRVGAISGAVGTFAHFSPRVEEHVCQSLGLKPAPASTQIIQRDRHAAFFTTIANLGNTLEKICVEIRHLQRSEVREVEEFFSPGQKGSSAMPHKRNPILSENVSGLARLLRSWAYASMENVALWHERDISHSSVERVIAPDATVTIDFMLARTNSIIDNLLVYPENMRRNLERTRGLYTSGGLLVALTRKGLSRNDAYRLIQKHAMEVWESVGNEDSKAQSFPDKVRGDKKITELLSEKELDELLALETHCAHVDEIFKRVFK